MNENMSPADVAAVVGNTDRNFAYPVFPYGAGYGNGFGNTGFGDGSWIWIILILALFGGFNGNGNGFGGGFNNDYAWLSNGQKEIMQNTNDGFNTLQLANQLTGINSQVQGLSTQICGCCGDIQNSLCNGFAGVNATVNSGFANAETAANARQMANMQQSFNNQLSTLQGFNGLSSQFADCCCENRLGLANLNSTILSENCADRAALAEGVRDIITNQTSNTQRILDQLCQDKIDSKNEKINDLQREILMKDLQASQVAQTADLRANNATVANQLVSELRSCPIPAQPVYGNQPIFTCSAQNTCGCGNF
jgi:hypothetical protein